MSRKTWTTIGLIAALVLIFGISFVVGGLHTNPDERFAGTDFTFEDLRTEDFPRNSYKTLADSTVDGQACYVVEATAKEADSSAYGKRQLHVDKARFLILKVEFFDKPSSSTGDGGFSPNASPWSVVTTKIVGAPPIRSSSFAISAVKPPSSSSSPCR